MLEGVPAPVLVVPSFVFPTKLISSRCVSGSKAAVNFPRTESVNVMADEFPIPPPSAPSASFFKPGSSETSLRRSSADIFVEVRASFSSGGICEGEIGR